MTTVYVPIALISLWGDDGTSRPATARFSHILDHTMALVSAVSVACLWTMTEARKFRFLSLHGYVGQRSSENSLWEQ